MHTRLDTKTFMEVIIGCHVFVFVSGFAQTDVPLAFLLKRKKDNAPQFFNLVYDSEILENDQVC